MSRKQSPMARPKAESEGTLLGVKQAALGAAAGLAGMAAMVSILGVAWLVGAFELSAVAGLASIVGLGESFPLGAVIFVGGGMTTIPLLFASLAVFMPGGDMGTRGAVFNAIVWTGFAVAFWSEQTGVTLALYLLFTLAAHIAYGYVLGTIYGKYAEIPVYDV